MIIGVRWWQTRRLDEKIVEFDEEGVERVATVAHLKLGTCQSGNPYHWMQ